MRYGSKSQPLGFLLLTLALVSGYSKPASASVCDSPACGAFVIVQKEDESVRFFRQTRIIGLVPGPRDEVSIQASEPGLADDFPGWEFGVAAQAPAGSVRTSAHIKSGDGAVGRVMVNAQANNQTELVIGGASNGQTVRFSIDLSIDGELDRFGSGAFAGTSLVDYRLNASNVSFVSGTESATGPSGFTIRDGRLNATFNESAPGTYLSDFNFTFDWIAGRPAPIIIQRMVAEAHLNGLANFFGTAKITAVTLPAGLSLSAEGLNFNEVAPGRFAVMYAPVPIPGAIWLFGTALSGLIFMHRRRNVAI